MLFTRMSPLSIKNELKKEEVKKSNNNKRKSMRWSTIFCQKFVGLNLEKLHEPLDIIKSKYIFLLDPFSSFPAVENWIFHVN